MFCLMEASMAELLIYFVPVFAGIIGNKYLGRLANFIVMIVVFQIDLAILFGQWKAASLRRRMFSFPARTVRSQTG
jgi:hypothetical protein